MGNKTFLILSGLVSRNSNYFDFWTGFLNLQYFLTTEDDVFVLGHTWDKSYKELVENVYGDIEISFDQFDKSNEVKMAISNAESITDQRLDSIPNFFYMYQSRRYALKLLRKHNISHNDRIILSRFDIGYRTVTPEGSTVIIDDSFPRDLIYLPFYNEIDQGYGDQWVVFNYSHLDFFTNLDIEILQIMMGSDYYYDYTHKWVNSKKRNRLANRYFYGKKIIFNKILKLLDNIHFNSLYLSRKLSGLRIILKDGQNVIGYTAENNSIIGTHFSAYSENSLINTHALLKYAIYKSNLRESVRFLDYQDFGFSTSGQLINQKSFAILIYSASSFEAYWEMIIKQMIKHFPRMKFKIYLATEESLTSRDKVTRYSSSVTPIFYSENNGYMENLIEIFETISAFSNNVYVTRENMPLISDVDEIYLNGLFHFIDYSNIAVVGLIESKEGKYTYDNIAFPGLVTKSTPTNFFDISSPILIKSDCFSNYLKTSNFSHENNQESSKNLLGAVSMVKGNELINKSFLTNSKFPHVVINEIAKSKIKNGWVKELCYLAEEYSLNLFNTGNWDDK